MGTKIKLFRRSLSTCIQHVIEIPQIFSEISKRADGRIDTDRQTVFGDGTYGRRTTFGVLVHFMKVMEI
jgi:hypothetical protein